jgi:site-specific DNA-methyltransferase (adenine-specific)
VRQNLGDRNVTVKISNNANGVADVTAPATDAAKQWDGWGTALKPAWEPIIVARKPFDGTVAENVQRHGTGALNIDECRVGAKGGDDYGRSAANAKGTINANSSSRRAAFVLNPKEQNAEYASPSGRWPANLIHDGSDEVLHCFPTDTKKATGRAKVSAGGQNRTISQSLVPSGMNQKGKMNIGVRDHGDAGSAARFFYCAKAGKKERGEGNTHPTVKPLGLMRYLCRLVTPPGGTILDPFMGSGSTLVAAKAEGFKGVGIELEEHYFQMAKKRLGEQEAPKRRRRGRIIQRDGKIVDLGKADE